MSNNWGSLHKKVFSKSRVPNPMQKKYINILGCIIFEKVKEGWRWRGIGGGKGRWRLGLRLVEDEDIIVVV